MDTDDYDDHEKKWKCIIRYHQNPFSVVTTMDESFNQEYQQFKYNAVLNRAWKNLFESSAYRDFIALFHH